MATLWLTRTVPSAPSPFVTALLSDGWQVRELPVLAIDNLVDDSLRQQLQAALAAAQHVLWTSANAVDAARAAWPARPPALRMHAVGERTALRAREVYGQAVQAPRRGHGGAAWWAEAQAEGMARPAAGERLLLLTGAHGRHEWLAPLRQAQVQVEVYALYRRQLRDCELPAAPPEVIVASSGEALRGLSQTIIDCARSSLFALPLLLPDERLEAVARGLGWSGRMAFLPRFTAAAVRAAVEDCR